jgi:hypothetical protein
MAARHTHSTMGRPAITRSTLRLKRVELSRAGITPAIRNVLMQASLQQQTLTPHLRRFPTQKSHPRSSLFQLKDEPEGSV